MNPTVFVTIVATTSLVMNVVCAPLQIWKHYVEKKVGMNTFSVVFGLVNHIAILLLGLSVNSHYLTLTQVLGSILSIIMIFQRFVFYLPKQEPKSVAGN